MPSKQRRLRIQVRQYAVVVLLLVPHRLFAPRRRQNLSGYERMRVVVAEPVPVGRDVRQSSRLVHVSLSDGKALRRRHDDVSRLRRVSHGGEQVPADVHEHSRIVCVRLSEGIHAEFERFDVRRYERVRDVEQGRLSAGVREHDRLLRVRVQSERLSIERR